MKAVYFDMDGTIADLYGVEGWLDSLIAEQTKPYREAKSLVDMRKLSCELNRLQRAGYHIGIVTWLSKNSSDEYAEKVALAKRKWLEKHLGSVAWNEICITRYGTPKSEVVEYPNGVLFDDEERNRKEWMLGDGLAFNVNTIVETLKAMVQAIVLVARAAAEIVN